MSTLTNETTEAPRQNAEAASAPTVIMPRPTSAAASSSPICVEIPVRLRGLQTAAPAESITTPADSFTEDTQTLILFPRGAVVRLAAAITAGQELMLTNLHSNQHVHCKVVSVRASETARGYVELEFTHRKDGFWGSAATAQNPASSCAALATAVASAAAESPAASLKSSFGAELKPPFDVTAQSAPALARVKPARAQHVLMTPAAPSTPEKRASADFEMPEPLAPDLRVRPRFALAGPRLDVETTSNRIAGDLRTGGKWILTGGCIAAAALAVMGGAFLLPLRSASGANGHANPAPTVAQAAPVVPVSAQVIEVRAEADSPVALPETNSAASAASELTQPSAVSTPPKSGGMGKALRNAAAKLHLSIGNSKLVSPTAAPASAAASAQEPPAVAAEESSSAVPGGQASGFAKGLISPAPPKAAEPTSLAVGGQASVPRIVSMVQPKYPYQAKTSHIEGDVTIQAEIDAIGKVANMKVLSGPALLCEAALDALRQWKYEPAKLNGQPVAGQLTVTLKFRLQ